MILHPLMCHRPVISKGCLHVECPILLKMWMIQSRISVVSPLARDLMPQCGLANPIFPPHPHIGPFLTHICCCFTLWVHCVSHWNKSWRTHCSSCIFPQPVVWFCPWKHPECFCCFESDIWKRVETLKRNQRNHDTSRSWHAVVNCWGTKQA